MQGDPVRKREQLIRRSERLIQWFDREIDGLEINADTRSRLAAACLDAAMEHHKAIVVLIAKELHGSAFALVRVIFETYVRGVWLHRCANESQLERFQRGGGTGTFSEVVDAVEKLEGFERRVLSAAKARSWKAMSGFTHTGFEQIVRRNTESTIEPNYDEDEILEALEFSRAMGCLSAIAICDLAGNNALANEILTKVRNEADVG
jgi:hypothetical protein